MPKPMATTDQSSFHPRPSSNRNLNLKIAIIESRKPQREIARDAGIYESRMSDIVNGRGSPATMDERRGLARVLHRSIRSLFPPIENTAA